MIIDLHQVDAFTNTLFGGNPAGVVTNANGLSETEMRKIAKEMNLSETAFVLKPVREGADIKLRFFTPEAEIKFCGHATIGALYELARLGMHGLDRDKTIQVETNAGLLAMTVSRDKKGEPRITFTAPGVKMEEYRLQGKAFADAFGMPANALIKDGAILIDKELNYVYIPVKSLEILGSLKFDFKQIHANFGEEKIVVFCLFANQTQRNDSDLHARGLAPLVGVDEDPFTGSMQAGLVHAAKQNGLLDQTKQRIVVEQGDFVGRPGFARINHNPATDELRVTADAVQVFSTSLELAR